MPTNLVFYSCEARLLRGVVAPLLGDGLEHGPGVGLALGADLLGHVGALLHGRELGHQLGHVLACSRESVVLVTLFFWIKEDPNKNIIYLQLKQKQ